MIDHQVLQNFLDAMVGRRIEGGCPDCLAYAKIARLEEGVYQSAIFHDSTCPSLAAATEQDHQ